MDTTSVSISTLENRLYENNISIDARLRILLELNSLSAKETSAFRDERERFEAETMKLPIRSGNAFALFGLMIGLFPPAAINLKIFFQNGGFQTDDLVIAALFVVANAVTATVGYYTGFLVSRLVKLASMFSFSNNVILTIFIGLICGIVSGGVGGIFILIFGAFFGSIIGGITGAVVLPVFTLLHRLLSRGGLIELKHFLPIAFGIAFSASAFILGL
ncbi:MAG: hypothetical protein ACT4O9_04425 [Blastocatellia bacterium]